MPTAFLNAPITEFEWSGTSASLSQPAHLLLRGRTENTDNRRTQRRASIRNDRRRG